MDYSSVDSELIESLDFLRPPVKRYFRNITKATSAHIDEKNINVQAFDNFRNKVSTETQHPQNNIRAEATTSSVVLNKTEEKIIEQYSVLSYTNLLYPNLTPKTTRADSPVSKEKPLIKVTVIPKSTQTKNTLRNRKSVAKRVQTTVSNQENSIQSRNVYLFVPSGNKKEKVYQIGNTGSASFTNSFNCFKDEVIPIEQLSSLKLVLDSLNMERKEKNKKKRKKPLVDSVSPDSSRKMAENGKSCDCTCYRDEVDVAGRKSFVRITGHLGLGEDDRYFLRCAATVNDKPVINSYTEAANSSLSPHPEDKRFFNICNVGSCPTRCYDNTTINNFSFKKDFNMQTDVQNEISFGTQVPSVQTKNIMRSKETQATQDDFAIKISSEMEKNKNPFLCKDEMIQCCCTNVDETNNPLVYKDDIIQSCYTNIEEITNPLRNRDEIIQCRCTNIASESDSVTSSVKACQSPLVIISVYPAPDCSDNVSCMKSHQREDKYFVPQKTIACNQNVKQRPHNENKEKRNESKINRPINRSPSPNRNQNKISNKNNLPETRLLRSRKPSPERDTTNNKQTKTNKERNLNKPFLNKDSRQKSPLRTTASNKITKATNTDHNITKKTIVDNYTKKLTAFMDNVDVEGKNVFAKNNPSKITVNIDRGTERYDVLFQQEDATTDLKVRKTVKGPENKNHKDSMGVYSSKRKFSMMPDEPVKGPQTVCSNKQLNDETPLLNTFSRLHLRDSLEISHRHDVKTGKSVKRNNFNTNDDSSGPFSAPIKHYTGDNCPIANPIQRDKEIRTLLGVDKGVHASITQETKPAKKKFTVPVHYYYNKTCEKKIVTGINLMEVPPCVCCDIRKKYYPTTPGSYHRQPVPPVQSLSGQQMLRQQQNQMLNQQNQMLSHHSQQLKQILSRHSQQLADQQKQSSIHQQLQASKSHHDAPVEEENKEETSSTDEDDLVVPNKSQSHKSRYRSNSTGTQYETQVQRTSLYQQLILNRNIQVFLQVEQFSKQKPIVLSRKQYDKVKRTIENTISNKTRERKKCICKTSLVSVGNVRVKPKYGQTLNYNGQSQTDKKDLGIRKKSSSNSNKSVRIVGRACVCPQDRKPSRQAVVLFSKETNAGTNHTVDKAPTGVMPRQTVSSIELHYASMSYMKHVTFSSTNVEVGSTCAELQQNESIHTIFKGHRKCYTPNLGTSMFSLYSEDLKPQVLPEVPKKKPFLRRLMSCLVMRSARASAMENAPNATPKPPSVESSIDSYHISTSLGAIEVSSSIYDTSASFYTNHSIYPIHNKIKRGFFSSVREFLTNRKS